MAQYTPEQAHQFKAELQEAQQLVQADMSLTQHLEQGLDSLGEAMVRTSTVVSGVADEMVKNANI